MRFAKFFLTFFITAPTEIRVVNCKYFVLADTTGTQALITP